MAETDSSLGGYTIGHLRMKYLNEADNAYARGGMENYLMCKRILDNFLGTIKENTDTSRMLKEKLDKIHQVKAEQITGLDNVLKNAGYLEKKDIEQEREIIEINLIHDMKTICWLVSLEQGLFYER